MRPDNVPVVFGVYMYKYYLFDLDGTLTDPKEGICKSVQYALKKHGIDEPNIDKLEPFIGPPLSQSFKEFYGMNEEEALVAVEDYRERFSVTGLYENVLYDGIPALLQALNEEGGVLAVASSKPTVYVEKILKHFDIDKYFKVVIGSELDGRRQDKAEVIEDALMELYYGKDTLGHSLSESEDYKNQTVMIGDRKFDIEGAKAMGIDSVGVSYGYGGLAELRKSGATHIAVSVDRLEKILLDGQDDEEDLGDGFGTLIPLTSMGRAVYVLVPLVIYYLCMLLITQIGKIVIDQIERRNLEAQFYIVDHSRAISALLSTGAMVLGIVVLWLLYRKKDPMPLERHKALPVVCLAGGFMALTMNLLIGYIYLAVSKGSIPESNNDMHLPIIIAIIMYVVASPIVEEFVFRWLMQGRIKRMLGRSIAVIVTALFFGIYHGSLLQGIYAFIMGIALSCVYDWTNSLLAPILFHMSANAFVYLSMYLPEKMKTVAGSYAGTAVLFVIAAVLMTISYRMTRREQTNV